MRTTTQYKKTPLQCNAKKNNNKEQAIKQAPQSIKPHPSKLRHIHALLPLKMLYHHKYVKVIQVKVPESCINQLSPSIHLKLISL